MIIGARGKCLVWLGSWCPFKTYAERIIVQKDSNHIEWKWDLDNIKQQGITPKLKACIENMDSITEAKRVSNGSKVVAIVGNAAAMIFDVPSASNHDTPTIRFAICVKNTHTLELLPDDFPAVATTGKAQSDGIEIYDLRTSTPLAGGPDPIPVQAIQGFPAVHGLLWDEKDQTLWAVGNDKSPEGDERSQGILRGLSFAPNSDRSTVLQVSEKDEFIIRPTDRLTAEWGSGTNWWNGPHDLVGIPNTRKVLVTSDLSVVGVDLESRVFLDEFEVDKILEGFTPIGGNRHGLPRSDIKSMSINAEGRVMYVQATWGQYYSDIVNLIEGKGVAKVRVEHNVYKAR